MKGIAIVIGLNFLALIAIFLFFKKRIDKSLRSNEIISTLQEEIEQLVIELNQTATRNIEIIEERINRLKEIVSQADKHIRVLNKELEVHEKTQETYANLKPKSVTMEKMKQSEKQREEGLPARVPVREKVIELDRRGMSRETIARELGITMAEIELILSLSRRQGRV